MKTEISRNSHDPEKKYSGVYQQQGRMITDADLNELTDIVKHRLDEALRDVVCIVDDDGASRGGTPRHCPLKVTGAGAIQPGRIYIDGVAAEVLGDPDSPIALDAQPDFPLSGGFSPPAAGTSYKLYADVWERVVTSLEDGGLLDSALHGADTCTRTKTMCQVKWCPAAKDPEDKTKNPKKGNAPLTISLKEDADITDRCDPCAKEMAVDVMTGDYLFRVEVHDVKGNAINPTEITLKWSSENGAEQRALEKVSSGAFKPLPGEFTAEPWVYEFFSDVSEKHLGVHLQTAAGFPARWPLTVNSNIPAGSPEPEYVRRWDGFITLKRTGAVWAIKKQTVNAESVIVGSHKGVQLSDAATDAAGKTGHVSLSTANVFTTTLDELVLSLNVGSRNILAGDYWLANVRQQEVAAYLDLDAALQTGFYFLGGGDGGVEPHGIEHHYLKLADVVSGTLQMNPEADRKYAFPPLTEMTRMFHAGGDGQEAMPGHELPQPIEVGVANGEWPVVGATVRFHIEEGGGFLSKPSGMDASRFELVSSVEAKVISLDGSTSCDWQVGTSGSQRVEASLLGADGNELKHPPIYFNANLSTADQVAYTSSCSANIANTAHNLLAHDSPPALTHTNPDYYTVKEVLDALLCKMKANHVPFVPDNCAGEEPTVKSGLGISAPTTVHAALQKLLCELDAADVPFEPGSCGSNALPTVRSKLNLSNRTTVHEALQALLCQMKAEHIPFTDKCSNGLYPDKVKTVADALKSLCNLDAGHVAYDPGCDYLKEKEAKTVQDAITALCAREVSGGDDCKTRLQMFGRGVVCGVTPSNARVTKIRNSRRVKFDIGTSPGVVVDGRGCIQRPGELSLTENVVAYQWSIPTEAVARIERWKKNVTDLLMSLGHARNSDEVKAWEDFVSRGFNSLYSTASNDVEAWVRNGGRQTWNLIDDRAVRSVISQLQEIIAGFETVPVESKFLLYLNVPEAAEASLKLVKVKAGTATAAFAVFRESAAAHLMAAGGATTPFASMMVADTSGLSGSAMQESAWKVFSDITCMQENDGSVCLATIGVYANKIWTCPDDREQLTTLYMYYQLNGRRASVYDSLAAASGARV